MIFAALVVSVAASFGPLSPDIPMVAFGPPTTADALQHLRAWERAPYVATAPRPVSHYAPMIAADALTTEMNYAVGIEDINPTVRAMPGPVGRVAFFALSTVAFGKIDASIARLHPALPLLLRSMVASVRIQMLSDNQALQSWVLPQRGVKP